MADPLDVLRAPLAPADPDPTFAATLRARIERALTLPRGVVVSATTAETQPARGAAAPQPEAGAAIPYLAVRGARVALDWYADVLGARVRGEPIVMPDGRIGHAELELGAGALYLADEHPEIGVVAPRTGESSVSLVLTVDDVDARVARLVERGGQLQRGPSESYGSRNAWVVDPFGHRWNLRSVAAPAMQREPLRQGDTSYVSLWVPDVERASAFYSAVLGWTVVGVGRGRQVADVTPTHGLWQQDGAPTLFCCFAVDDVRAAVERVRAAGGRASAPRQEAYGVIADCSDDQGAAFALAESLPDDPAARRAVDGTIAYLVVETPDSARARAFYGSVLGWRFRPGSVPDGFQVDDVVPMTGMSGGAARPAVVPMYRVDDIAAAVERVRERGGTATDPERQPYGISSTCVDDQGTRFYLGQL